MTLRTNEMAGKGILGTQRGIKKSTTYILMAVLVLNRWLKKKKQNTTLYDKTRGERYHDLRQEWGGQVSIFGPSVFRGETRTMSRSEGTCRTGGWHCRQRDQHV